MWMLQCRIMNTYLVTSFDSKAEESERCGAASRVKVVLAGKGVLKACMGALPSTSVAAC